MAAAQHILSHPALGPRLDVAWSQLPGLMDEEAQVPLWGQGKAGGATPQQSRATHAVDPFEAIKGVL